MSVIGKSISVSRNTAPKPGLMRHIVGIASVLFTFKDPYDVPVIPKVIGSYKDEEGYTVLKVQANNYREVNQFSGNVAGRRVVHTHVGRNQWEVRTEDNGG